MRKIFFTLVLISFAFHSQAQLQLSPSTIDRPAILSTYNSAPFSIGMENTSLLHFSTNLRLGLGTRYLSNGAENFVNYAKFHIRHNSSGAVSQISGSPHLVLD